MCMYVYIYIYIYESESERERERGGERELFHPLFHSLGGKWSKAQTSRFVGFKLKLYFDKYAFNGVK